MGFGFRGSSPPYPYIGIGRGGLPRCSYFAASLQPVFPAGAVSYAPTGEQELEYLKNQADAINDQLQQIESRIRNLETTEKK
jgi:hypothetical protein